MLTINKIDLNGRTIERVPFRNTLLETLHGDVAVAVVHVDPDAVQQDRPTVEAALGRDLHGLRLDFASGSKKHGDLFFTDARPRLTERYWSTPEEAMAYGGLLVTECDYPPQIMDMPILVVEQGRLGTGDCAGFIHPDLLARFDLPDDVAVQGRVAYSPRPLPALSKVEGSGEGPGPAPEPCPERSRRGSRRCEGVGGQVHRRRPPTGQPPGDPRRHLRPLRPGPPR